MTLTLIIEHGSQRFAVDEQGEWWSSWCFKNWMPAFRYNPVPADYAALVSNTETRPE